MAESFVDSQEPALDEAVTIIGETTGCIIYRHPEGVESHYSYKQLRNGRDKAAGRLLLESELATLQQLSHIDGVIRASAVQDIEGQPTLILEYGGDFTLTTWRFLNQTPSIEKTLEIAIQMCRILGDVHDNGVIHRDIKPANFLWNAKTSKLRLLNFELATRGRNLPPLNLQSSLANSLPYISPEQTGRLQAGLDYRSDLYALGVSLYELFCGQLPFEAFDLAGFVHAHLAQQPIPPHQIRPDIPKNIGRIILRLLEKSASDRYRSSAGVAVDLNRCLQQLGSEEEREVFPLGENDISRFLTISTQLYGRDEALSSLQEQAEVACASSACLTLISGPSGSGKTSLVDKLRSHIRGLGVRMIRGKYEFSSTRSPYQGLIHAFSDLVNQILSESTSWVEKIRTEIIESLGPNSAVLTHVIPDLELIIGRQAPPSELATTESPNRFKHTLHAFIKVFAKAEHPLAIFLDDLHWSDGASLDVLKSLILDQTPHLYVIGTYRALNHRTEEASALEFLIQDLTNTAPTKLHTLSLPPLKISDIKQLLADSFHRSPTEVAPLAQLCAQKTGSNPYFVNKFLALLDDLGVLKLDRNKGHWTWDTQAIQAIEVTSNVVDLLVARLDALTPSQRTLLSTAACIGSSFDLTLLSRVLNEAKETVRARVYEAVGLELLVPSDAPQTAPFEAEIFAFRHDRIQEVALTFCSNATRRELHHHIALILLADFERNDSKISVFQICDHIGDSYDLVTDPIGQLKWARLNLKAGNAAIGSLAYKSAIRYYQHGLKWAQLNHDWYEQQLLFFQLSFGHALAEYSAGNITRAYELTNSLLTRAETSLQKASVYSALIAHKVQQFDIPSALRLGLDGLKLMNFEFSLTPTEAEDDTLETQLQELMKSRNISELIYAEQVTSSKLIGTHQIIASMHDAAYIGHPALFRTLVRFATILSIEHGIHRLSPVHFALYASILAVKGEPSALEWGELADHLNWMHESFQFRAKVCCVLGTIVVHPFKPYRETRKYILESVKYGTEYGDWNYATYANLHGLNDMLVCGIHLKDLKEEAHKALETSFQTKMMSSTFAMQIQLVDILMNGSDTMECLDGAWFSEDTFIAENHEHPYLLYDLYFKKTLLSILMGKSNVAYEQAKVCAAGISSALLGSSATLSAQFYFGLAIADWWDTAPAEDHPQLLQEFSEQHDQVRKFAARCPSRYEHALYLLDAELHRMKQDASRLVFQAYDRAIDSALKHNHPHHAGFAAERALRLSVAESLTRSAIAYFDDAWTFFLDWGASAKVAALKNTYPSIARNTRIRRHADVSIITQDIPSSPPTSNISLDAISVVKAAHSISRQVRLDRLLTRLITLLIENAGAERGCLLLKDENSSTLRVEATGTLKGGASDVLAGIEVSRYEHLPHSLIRKVERTQLPVVVEDAMVDLEFDEDPYIKNTNARSILCAPISNQGHICGLFYLENNLIPKVFTSNRLEALEILSGQAAVSIENARLYQKLEERVAALRQAEQRAQVASEAKSRFLAQMSHEVRTPTAAAISWLDLAQSPQLSDGDRLEHISSAQEAIEHLMQVLENVLDFARIDQGQVELNIKQANIEQVLHRSFSIVQSLVSPKQDIQLDSDIRFQHPWRLFDPKRVQQIVINLLSNAIKFTRSGFVRLVAQELDTGVQIAVIDSGIGMTEDQIKQIFKPFTHATTSIRSSYGSAGLGLTIVDDLVRRMSGHIAVQSRPGRGSTFELYLPLDSNEPVSLPSESNRQSSHHRSLKVLAADDNAVNRKIVTRVLKNLGHHPTVVEDGQQAINRLAAGETYDFIILDIQMPILDGLETVKVMRQRDDSRKLPIIALSANAFEEDHRRSLDAGFDRHLTKPLRTTVLETVIRELVDTTKEENH